MRGFQVGISADEGYRCSIRYIYCKTSWIDNTDNNLGGIGYWGRSLFLYSRKYGSDNSIRFEWDYYSVDFLGGSHDNGGVGNRRSVMLRWWEDIPDGIRENVSWQGIEWYHSSEGWFAIGESKDLINVYEPNNKNKMKKLNCVILEGDWNDGDILRNVYWMTDEELEVFLERTKKVDTFYNLYREEVEPDIRDLGDISFLRKDDYDELPEEITSKFSKEEFVDILEYLEDYSEVIIESESGCGSHDLDVSFIGPFEVPDDFKVEETSLYKIYQR